MPFETPTLPEFSSAVGVLSAMITPAILILASGNILGTTSMRLIRAHDRLRQVSEELKHLYSEGGDDEISRDRREVLFIQLDSATRRARLLQRAMTYLYLSIAAFVLTSILIGVVALSRLAIDWLSLALGYTGAMLLLAASVLLIFESRLAVNSTRAETEFATRWGAHLRGSSQPRVSERHAWSRRCGDPRSESEEMRGPPSAPPDLMF